MLLLTENVHDATLEMEAIMEITVTSNVQQAANHLGEFRNSVTWKAMRRSIVRTLQGTRAYAAQEIRKGKIAKLSAEEIKKGVTVRVLGEYSRVSTDLAGSVWIGERALSVTRMHARTVRRGHRIGVQVKSLDGRAYRVGFPIVMTSNALSRSKKKTRATIANRITDKTIVLKRKGKARYPLVKVFGPSLADIVRYSALERNISQYAKMRLAKEIEQNLNHFARQAQKAQ